MARDGYHAIVSTNLATVLAGTPFIRDAELEPEALPVEGVFIYVAGSKPITDFLEASPREVGIITFQDGISGEQTRDALAESGLAALAHAHSTGQPAATAESISGCTNDSKSGVWRCETPSHCCTPGTCGTMVIFEAGTHCPSWPLT